MRATQGWGWPVAEPLIALSDAKVNNHNSRPTRAEARFEPGQGTGYRARRWRRGSIEVEALFLSHPYLHQ